MPLSVSVILPVHNGGSPFRQCLRALLSARPVSAEIIVVPDGESDGAWRHALGHGIFVLKPDGGSRGPAYARNRGALHASGDILFFVDADVVVPPGIIGEIQDAFSQDERLDALIGSYDDAPAEPGFLSQYRNLLHHYVHQTSNQEASTFWGACGAIRRDVFLRAGGFDESYREASIEDIELGYRLKQSGRTIRLKKNLQVKHLKKWRIGSMLRTDLLRRAVPWTTLMLQSRSLQNDLNLRTESRLSVVAAYTFAFACVGALWWVEAVYLAVATGLLLLALNAPLYDFFRRKRGWTFALGSIPWHWLYFLYGGLGFVIGAVMFLARTGPRGRVPKHA